MYTIGEYIDTSTSEYCLVIYTKAKYKNNDPAMPFLEVYSREMSVSTRHMYKYGHSSLIHNNPPNMQQAVVNKYSGILYSNEDGKNTTTCHVDDLLDKIFSKRNQKQTEHTMWFL